MAYRQCRPLHDILIMMDTFAFGKARRKNRIDVLDLRSSHEYRDAESFEAYFYTTAIGLYFQQRCYES